MATKGAKTKTPRVLCTAVLFDDGVVTVDMTDGEDAYQCLVKMRSALSYHARKHVEAKEALP